MLTVSPVSAKVIVQSPMSWCKSSTPPPLARGTKSLVKALIMVQEVLSDHMALPAQAKDEVLVTEMRVILHQVPEDRPRAERDHRFGNRFGIVADPQALAAAKQNNFHGYTSTSGMGTTNRASQSRAYASCVMISSLRFQDRIRISSPGFSPSLGSEDRNVRAWQVSLCIIVGCHLPQNSKEFVLRQGFLCRPASSFPSNQQPRIFPPSKNAC